LALPVAEKAGGRQPTTPAAKARGRKDWPSRNPRSGIFVAIIPCCDASLSALG